MRINLTIQSSIGEITRIKGLVLRKVKQLMFLDYVKYLVATKKTKEIKINHRIVDLLDVLVQTGRVPLDKFLAAAPIATLYNNASAATKSRDFKKLNQLALVRTIKENNKVYIEPNFAILDSLQYRV